jgi:hypothetical protein
VGLVLDGTGIDGVALGVGCAATEGVVGVGDVGIEGGGNDVPLSVLRWYQIAKSGPMIAVKMATITVPSMAVTLVIKASHHKMSWVM